MVILYYHDFEADTNISGFAFKIRQWISAFYLFIWVYLHIRPRNHAKYLRQMGTLSGETIFHYCTPPPFRLGQLVKIIICAYRRKSYLLRVGDFGKNIVSSKRNKQKARKVVRLCQMTEYGDMSIHLNLFLSKFKKKIGVKIPVLEGQGCKI